METHGTSDLLSGTHDVLKLGNFTVHLKSQKVWLSWAHIYMGERWLGSSYGCFPQTGEKSTFFHRPHCSQSSHLPTPTSLFRPGKSL
jgi:hypothetical protein